MIFVFLQDYYVADTSENQIMLCVNHEGSSSHLYISNVNGTKFTMSLEDILYFSPNLTYDNSWLRYKMFLVLVYHCFRKTFLFGVLF